MEVASFQQMIDFEAGNNNIPEGIQVLSTTATLNEIDFFLKI